MGTHQHIHEKSPPRCCGARRLISTTESRLMPALSPRQTPLRAHAAMESRAKAVQAEPRTAGDNGFTSGARR